MQQKNEMNLPCFSPVCYVDFFIHASRLLAIQPPSPTNHVFPFWSWSFKFIWFVLLLECLPSPSVLLQVLPPHHLTQISFCHSLPLSWIHTHTDHYHFVEPIILTFYRCSLINEERTEEPNVFLEKKTSYSKSRTSSTQLENHGYESTHNFKFLDEWIGDKATLKKITQENTR